MKYKSFSELLKEKREAKGYSMNQLAEKAGISASLISRLEGEKRPNPKPPTIKKISRILGGYEELMTAAGYLPEDVNKGKAAPEPTRTELEEFLKRSDIHFAGVPLDDEDKDDLIEFIKLINRKKRK